MGEQVAAGITKRLIYAKAAVELPQPHMLLNIEGTECVPPITAGHAVKHNWFYQWSEALKAFEVSDD